MSRSSVARTPASGSLSRQLTCLIVEDQAMFLELLEGMLSIRGGLQVVGRARTVADGVAACSSQVFDLLLLDLALPDGNGLRVAQAFLKRNHRGKVIVVTGHASSFVCPIWLDAHLQAVISKNDTFQSLRAELDELLSTARPKTRKTTVQSVSKPLTNREAEVFSLMGEGLSSKEIADRLGLAVHTVLTHRKRLATKLGTRGSELTRRAMAQRVRFFGPRDERP